MHSTSTSSSESPQIDQLVPFKKSTLHRRVDVATNDGDCDHHVQDAGELVAAAHVTDRHDVGTDHAGQLGGWLRLADHVQAAQSIMPAAVVTRGPPTSEHVREAVGRLRALLEKKNSKCHAPQRRGDGTCGRGVGIASARRQSVPSFCARNFRSSPVGKTQTLRRVRV